MANVLSIIASLLPNFSANNKVIQLLLAGVFINLFFLSFPKDENFEPHPPNQRRKSKLRKLMRQEETTLACGVSWKHKIYFCFKKQALCWMKLWSKQSSSLNPLYLIILWWIEMKEMFEYRKKKHIILQKTSSIQFQGF